MSLAAFGLGEDASRVNESCMDFLIMEMVQQMHKGPGGVEVDKEAAYFKLENLGYRVGFALAERFTKDKPRFVDSLDVVKFICRDFWMELFKKNIDNLKTNHRGTFVLTDNSFRWFQRMSDSGGGLAATSLKAFPYLAFPCGLIRGVLANTGLSSVVIAEVSNMPQCIFQIKIKT
ncbi:NO signaling/Golgi transport ligand-binding domain-containing protein [Polychytrium aggregatum]|uniref:NO signaling/Golgi transport ligand-binding domain-containing protein n=1 Tax=Polychytrium aggregatum TaxID=110093 RepID=UPI0022FEC382|nr:NO signaling/Golgi transport ligand-binding domain-containing protein [Polychytrium aggregatum]KAI9201806.1 NO signaling/Golgi transport ligand-binding domain-containing protein [Polychytrium aggregatum]